MSGTTFWPVLVNAEDIYDQLESFLKINTDHSISNQKVLSVSVYCEQKCKSAAAIAKAQSGIAFKSITDPPSSFSSLKMTETC